MCGRRKKKVCETKQQSWTGKKETRQWALVKVRKVGLKKLETSSPHLSTAESNIKYSTEEKGHLQA